MFKKRNGNNLNQRIRYRFLKHETKGQIETVFFYLETYNDQELAEAYAAGSFDVKSLRDRWDRDLTVQEKETERENVIVFDGSNGSLVIRLLTFISENYEGDGRTYIDKDGDEIVSSYRLLLVAHNSCGFDSWVVFNSLVEEITDLKIIKTAEGLISLLLWCVVEKVNTCEVPQNVIFTSTKSHIKGGLENIGTEYGLQPELLRGEIQQSVINKSNFADLRHIWEPYLKLDVLCLAFIYARNSLEKQIVSEFGIKACLTEASLGWKCFGTSNKDSDFCTFDDKYIRDFIRKTIKAGRIAPLHRYFESNQCDKTLNTIEIHLRINGNEISKKVDENLNYIIIKRDEFMLEFEKGGKDY